MQMLTALQPAAPAFSSRLLSEDYEANTSLRIERLGATRIYARGRMLFSEGDEAGSVYEIVRGMVRLYKVLPDGRRQIMGFLSDGDLVGLATAGRYLYTAETITATTVRSYARSKFDRMLEEVPGFARRLLTLASDELRAAQEQMLLLGRKSATEKIASFLLALAARQTGDGAAREQVMLPMTRTDIADYLGLTIETVSRVLWRLKRDEVIALPSTSCFEILDEGRLEELAAGDQGPGAGG
jgi:CRP/FNR family transcriptional regulator, anaerobic regulatory protein